MKFPSTAVSINLIGGEKHQKNLNFLNYIVEF